MLAVEQLSLVSRLVRTAARHEAAGRTSRPFQHLRALRLIHHGARTQADLAEQLQIDPPAASRLVDRLVRDGLVERRAGRDRRCVGLAVRRAAARDVTIADAVVAAIDARVAGSLTAAEARTLEKLLAKIADGLAAEDARKPTR